MRHHADDAAGLVAYAGYISLRTIRVGRIAGLAVRIAVAQHNAPLRLKQVERYFVRKIVAFRMCDGHTDHLALSVGTREVAFVVVDARYPRVNEYKLNTGNVTYPYNCLLLIEMRIIIICHILTKGTEIPVFIDSYVN